MPTLPCISLWQPWALLWAKGHKRNETRSWPLRLKLPAVLAVHAARLWNADLWDVSVDEPFASCLEACGVGFPHEWGSRTPRPAGMPFGAVVGLVRVCAVVPTSLCERGESGSPPPAGLLIPEREWAFGDYAPGRFAWVTDRRHDLAEPVPLRGRQGVWNWDAPPSVLLAAEGMMR